MKHRAFCRTDNRFVGNENLSEDLANVDKNIHQAQNPTHDVTVIHIVEPGDIVSLIEPHLSVLKGSHGKVLSGPFTRDNVEFFHVDFKNDSHKFRKVESHKLFSIEPTQDDKPKSFGPTIGEDEEPKI